MSIIKKAWKSKFGKDVVITSVGQFVILLVALGINKILSIELGPVGFAEYSIAKRAAAVFGFIMIAGLGIAIPKYLSKLDQENDRLNKSRYIIVSMSIMFILSFITLIIVIFFNEILALMLFGDRSHSHYIFAILSYALSITFTTFVFSYYRGLDKFVMYSTSQIFVQLSSLFVAIIVNSSVISFLYSSSIITGAYGLYMCIRLWRIHYIFAKIKSFNQIRPIFTELLFFCLPRIPGEIVLFGFTAIPLIIISHKMSIEYSAYFAVAITINTMIQPFFGMIGAVLLSFVSKSIVGERFGEAEAKINVLSKIYFIVGLIVVMFIEIFTPFLVNLLFSKEFEPSVPIIRIVAIAILPNIYYLLLRNPLDAMSRFPYNSINLIISFLLLNLLLIYSSSMEAFAVSFVVSYFVLGILSFATWFILKKKLIKSDYK
ncbi:oligosaccharide flippase family protein [Bacillus sp. FJAT-28004]|uniref:oligosaccharide flippase family protein n=1 Tax=Bacillus sp. FJAT-28004 TaxID=1679165 RepID=UPI0006B3FD8E|nr:oligosaccharide flippase family protein [Bacillus sp. FJAT-28004]